MTTEAGRQLAASGYLTYFLEYQEEATCLRGIIDTPRLLVEMLRRDKRFACGMLYGCHQDVGNNLIDFRSYNGKLGRGSLQIVFDKTTGNCYSDYDRHNPYNDVVRFVGHAYDVIHGWWDRLKPQS